MTTLDDELKDSRTTKITGQDELLAVDVYEQLGKNVVSVSQLVIENTILNAVMEVSTIAIELKVGVSRLANRKSLLIQPESAPIFIGNSGVTVSNGVQIFKNQIITVDADIAVYAIANAETSVRIIEAN